MAGVVNEIALKAKRELLRNGDAVLLGLERTSCLHSTVKISTRFWNEGVHIPREKQTANCKDNKTRISAKSSRATGFFSI